MQLIKSNQQTLANIETSALDLVASPCSWVGCFPPMSNTGRHWGCSSLLGVHDHPWVPVPSVFPLASAGRSYYSRDEVAMVQGAAWVKGPFFVCNMLYTRNQAGFKQSGWVVIVVRYKHVALMAGPTWPKSCSGRKHVSQPSWSIMEYKSSQYI